MTNHYTDVCEETIKSLRQQLAERDAELKRINHAINDNRVDLTITAAEAITELRQQVTLLRDALTKLLSVSGCSLVYHLADTPEQRQAKEALTATEPK